MDKASLDFLNRRVSGRLAKIRNLLPHQEEGRGKGFIILIRLLLRGADLKRKKLIESFSKADSEEQEVIGRSLLRLTHQIEIFHNITPYLAGVDRRDLHVGTLRVIDQLIAELLPKKADPVIHLDEHYMYSTLDLVSALTGAIQSFEVSFNEPSSPTAFSLPATDPGNVFLSPILAHEVGHVAIEQADLGSTVLDQTDQDSLNKLLEECLDKADNPNPGEFQVPFVHWLDELISDALATVLTGPSFLFASAAFLPAPDIGTLGSHPFPADRLRFTLSQLDVLGWTQFLESRIPKVLSWLRSLDQDETNDPKERFLRGAMKIAEPAILIVARDHIPNGLGPESFESSAEELIAHFRSGIPPAQVDGKPVSTWTIVLSSWMYEFDKHGDEPITIAKAIDDEAVSDFVSNVIEMSNIAELWRTL